MSIQKYYLLQMYHTIRHKHLFAFFYSTFELVPHFFSVALCRLTRHIGATLLHTRTDGVPAMFNCPCKTIRTVICLYISHNIRHPLVHFFHFTLKCSSPCFYKYYTVQTSTDRRLECSPGSS